MDSRLRGNDGQFGLGFSFDGLLTSGNQAHLTPIDLHNGADS